VASFNAFTGSLQFDVASEQFVDMDGEVRLAKAAWQLRFIRTDYIPVQSPRGFRS